MLLLVVLAVYVILKILKILFQMLEIFLQSFLYYTRIIISKIELRKRGESKNLIAIYG